LIQREETFPVIGGLGGDFETSARGRTVLRLKTWESKNQKAKVKGQKSESVR
jgi:hypothetical protein